MVTIQQMAKHFDFTRLWQVYYHGDASRQFGGFAEYALSRTIAMRHIPEGMSFETAAAIPSGGWYVR